MCEWLTLTLCQLISVSRSSSILGPFLFIDTINDNLYSSFLKLLYIWILDKSWLKGYNRAKDHAPHIMIFIQPYEKYLSSESCMVLFFLRKLKSHRSLESLRKTYLGLLERHILKASSSDVLLMKKKAVYL